MSNMVLAEAVVVAGVTKVMNDTVFPRLEKKIDDNTKEIQKVKVVHDEDDYVYARLKRITSTNQEIQKNADRIVANPLKVPVKIKSISVICDSVFKTKGMLVITVNDVEVFRNETVADFTDVTSMNIPLSPQNKTLKPDKSVKFFIWNGTDSNAVALTTFVHLGGD